MPLICQCASRVKVERLLKFHTMNQSIAVEFERPLHSSSSGVVCSTRYAWAKIPSEPSPVERRVLKEKIRRLLKERDAVLVSHYYVHPDLQDLAEETGGLVSDSLEMARFGRDHAAQTLVVSGVRFMGESAKILSPHKTVLMPDLDAQCSLDLGCPADDFSAFCDAHPDRTVVVYANTSALVKARSDWLVTSSCAVDIVRALSKQGQKILWAPDRHLGGYIQRETGADMLMWQGSCIVHDEFKAFELEALKNERPDAKVLVHPESSAAVVALADYVGSTKGILQAAQKLDATEFIVATDNGMLHKLRQANPSKNFIEAPTAGDSATCKSCAHCPWMAMNSLADVARVLETGENAIEVDAQLIARARLPIDRMLAFTSAFNADQPLGTLVSRIGAA